MTKNVKIKVLTRSISKIAKDNFLIVNSTEMVLNNIELVEADSNDVQSLNKAFKNAYGVFAVTNFWEVFSA